MSSVVFLCCKIIYRRPRSGSVGLFWRYCWTLTHTFVNNLKTGLINKITICTIFNFDAVIDNVSNCSEIDLNIFGSSQFSFNQAGGLFVHDDIVTMRLLHHSKSSRRLYSFSQSRAICLSASRRVNAHSRCRVLKLFTRVVLSRVRDVICTSNSKRKNNIYKFERQLFHDTCPSLSCRAIVSVNCF